jgi:Family of unknown function (DUF5320)
MPRFDGTGPEGKGPMTGRGSGYCALPLKTKEQELQFLKNQERVLKQELHSIRTMIKNLTIPREKTTVRRK